MKAIILAAGRGSRLRPITDTTPKPLVKVGDYALIEHHLFALSRAGVQEVAINLHYKGDMVEQQVGQGDRYGLKIMYSREDTVLGTGGGVKQALALLGDGPFILVSADIYSDYDLAHLLHCDQALGHCVLVDNPTYHQEGDFGLDVSGFLVDAPPRLTYASMSVLHSKLFEAFPAGVFSLGDVLKSAVQQRLLTGEHYSGNYHNVGDLTSLELARGER